MRATSRHVGCTSDVMSPVRALCLVGLLAGCGASDSGDGDDSAGALINGTTAPPIAEISSVVRIHWDCTATQIAPRLLLTAAHCVQGPDGALLPAYAAGRELSIGARDRAGRLVDASAKIKETQIHPYRVTTCPGATIKGCGAAPDVAYVKLDGDARGVGITPISTVKARADETVIGFGFGCVEHLDGDSDTLLRQADLSVLDPTRATSPNRPADPATEDLARNVFLVTEGPAYRGTSAGGVCPGDSGGPVVRRSTSKPGSFVVLGVNSFVKYRETNGKRIPETNWHSRVDVFARHEVFSWLERAGATFAH